MNDNIKRSGVIPYTLTQSNKLLFMLGVDRSGDYSDWSGRISKNDRDVYHTASRELKEESLGSILFSPTRIEKGISFSGKSSMCTLVYAEPDEFLEYPIKFWKNYARCDKSKAEMHGIKCLTESELFECIENEIIYDLIAELLKEKLPESIKKLQS